jgi:hypothetical protein
VLAALVLAGCPAARAGTWAVVSCATPGGQPAPTDGWLAGGAGDYKGSINTCNSPGGALIAQVGDQTEQPAYQAASWTFTAPGGSKIAGGTLRLGFFDPEGQGYAETPENSYDAADVIGNCQYNAGTCATHWIDQADSISQSQAGGTQIFLGAECVAPIEGHDFCQQPGDPMLGAEGIDAQTDLYSAVIDLQNSSTPSASGFSGGLLSPDATGTQDLLFSAADPGGPGIIDATVTIDGTIVYNGTPDRNGGRCHSIGADPTGAAEFLYEQPCKQTVAVDIPVNTASVPTGTHQLQVALTDAAGNTAIVYSSTISTSDPDVPNGTPCAGAQLSVRIDGRDRIGAVSYGRALNVRGWLHCASTPIRDAELTLTGAGPRRLILTGPHGHFDFRIKRGPSRTITVAYRAYSNDTTPTVDARLKIAVRPTIKLQITPTRTHDYRTILWRGDIAGGPYPPSGLTLLVQVKDGDRWETFDQLLTHNGRFEYAYTFERTTQPTTYIFRIALPLSGAAGYPYLSAASRAIAVHVSP